MNPKIVSPQEWLDARVSLLAKEKELTRLRDELAQQRKQLPWVRVDKSYTFEGVTGKVSLSELFGDKTLRTRLAGTTSQEQMTSAEACGMKRCASREPAPSSCQRSRKHSG